MTRGLYLPPDQRFRHIAQVPWPVDPRHLQSDWIAAIDTIDTWLEQQVGPHDKEWHAAESPTRDWTLACIAFREERMKTLFLLRWT